MVRRIGLLFAAALVTACQAAGTPTTAPTVAGTPAAASTAVASPQSTATTAPTKPVTLPRTVDIPLNGTCEDEGVGCLGKLEAGKVYVTRSFTPKLTFTVPTAGWVNPNDAGGDMGLFSTRDVGDAIMFFSHARSVDPSVGTTVDAIATWLQAHDSLAVSAPVPAAIGGLKGVSMNITLAPGTGATDPGCPVQACVTFLRGDDPVKADPYQWHWDWGMAGTETQRLYLLDAKGIVVAIFVDSIDGLTFPTITATFDKIAPTIKFAK
jgi:hypothetical protein